MASRSSRLSRLTLFALLLSSCKGPPPQATQPCVQANTAACEEGATTSAGVARLLICGSDGGGKTEWSVYSDCRGDGGCILQEGSLFCDTSKNTTGDQCAPPWEGKTRCEPATQARILRCESGILTSLLDCPAGTHCLAVDGGPPDCVQ